MLISIFARGPNTGIVPRDNSEVCRSKLATRHALERILYREAPSVVEFLESASVL